MSMMPFIFGNTTYYSKAEADARIAALEAEIARLNEAGRVLARVAVAEHDKIESAERQEWYDPKWLPAAVLNNPTARAWVEEVANAKQQS